MDIAQSAGKLLPITELFKKSLSSYWQKKWTLIRLVLFGFISAVPILIFGGIAFLISFNSFSQGEYMASLILIDILLGLVGIFFAILFGLWSRAALVFAVKQNDRAKIVLETAWPKLASFFWVGLLAGLANLGGFILFVIPGIIFSIWFSFSLYVFVVEGAKGTSALKRSKQLVRGYWWPVFGRFIIIGVISVLISWIKGIGPLLNAFFVAPFAIVYAYELFLDLKRIKNY